MSHWDMGTWWRLWIIEWIGATRAAFCLLSLLLRCVEAGGGEVEGGDAGARGTVVSLV